MKRLLVIAAMLGGLAGCAVDPVSTKQADDNPAVRVEVIATFDGIRLYAVDVGDRRVYVAARVTGEVDTNWMRPEGRTHVPDGVQTLPH